MSPSRLLSARRSGREFGYDVVRGPLRHLGNVVLVLVPAHPTGPGKPQNPAFRTLEGGNWNTSGCGGMRVYTVD